jgi:hypothetical protein
VDPGLGRRRAVERGRGGRRRRGELVDRPQGEPCERVALALVEGYRRAGGVFSCGSPTVLAGSLSAVANWLDLNVRRSLDDAAEGRDRQQAEAEIAGVLRELAWRLARLDRWIDLLG